MWYVKFIGEIGRTNAVCAHFIEWSENLQERLMNEEVARVSMEQAIVEPLWRS